MSKFSSPKLYVSVPYLNGLQVSVSVLLLLWYPIKCLVFMTSLPYPRIVKTFLLRLFGAEIGRKTVLKPRINIHYPWNLSLGSHVWIGEGVEIYNFEKVSVGNNVCISQRAFLCAAGHDYRDPFFSYRHSSIYIADGVWIQAGAMICGGSHLSEESVVKVCSVFSGHSDANSIYSGNPSKKVGIRYSLDKEALGVSGISRPSARA